MKEKTKSFYEDMFLIEVDKLKKMLESLRGELNSVQWDTDKIQEKTASSVIHKIDKEIKSLDKALNRPYRADVLCHNVQTLTPCRDCSCLDNGNLKLVTHLTGECLKDSYDELLALQERTFMSMDEEDLKWYKDQAERILVERNKRYEKKVDESIQASQKTNEEINTIVKEKYGTNTTV